MIPTIEQVSRSITRRTRRFVGGSTVAHILLLLLLFYHHSAATATAGITEITWVALPAPEPPKPEPAAPPIARKEEKAEPVRKLQRVAARNEPTRQFKRELVRARVEPTPQSATSLEDVLERTLESDKSRPGAQETQIASMVALPEIGMPTPAGVPDRPRQAATPTDLKRDAKPSTVPTELQRMPIQSSDMSVAATLPTIDTPRRASAEVAPSDAVRHLAGAQLVGQVADRELKSYVKPEYPEWAKQDGVEASVTLRFYVLPDGRVKDNIFVEKTSGFSDFDGNAVAALLSWRFEPLPAAGEQWGVITFNYRLSDSR